MHMAAKGDPRPPCCFGLIVVKTRASLVYLAQCMWSLTLCNYLGDSCVKRLDWLEWWNGGGGRGVELEES